MKQTEFQRFLYRERIFVEDLESEIQEKQNELRKVISRKPGSQISEETENEEKLKQIEKEIADLDVKIREIKSSKNLPTPSIALQINRGFQNFDSRFDFLSSELKKMKLQVIDIKQKNQRELSKQTTNYFQKTQFTEKLEENLDFSL